MTWKRLAAAKVGDALKLNITRKGRATMLLQAEQLAKFFSEFEIDCIFDVGANIGQYARQLREVGYRGTIISFEPIPALGAQLRVAAEHDRHWFIESVALDETEADVSFNVMKSSVFSSLKQPTYEETTGFEDMNVVVETLILRTARLDGLYDRYQAQLGFSRPFLKMDTQGNDLAVARGAGDRLSKFVGLQSELTVKRLYARQSDYREAIDFYEASGFVLNAIFPNTDHFPDLIEFDCVMYNPAMKRPNNLGWTAVAT